MSNKDIQIKKLLNDYLLISSDNKISNKQKNIKLRNITNKIKKLNSSHLINKNKSKSKNKNKSKKKISISKSLKPTIDIIDSAKPQSTKISIQEALLLQDKLFPKEELDRQIVPVPTFFNSEAQKALELRIDAHKQQLLDQKLGLERALKQQKDNLNIKNNLLLIEAKQNQLQNQLQKQNQSQSQGQSQGQTLNLNINDLSKQNNDIIDIINDNDNDSFLNDQEKKRVSTIKNESNKLTQQIINLQKENNANPEIFKNIEKKLFKNTNEIKNIYKNQHKLNVKLASIDDKQKRDFLDEHISKLYKSKLTNKDQETIFFKINQMYDDNKGDYTELQHKLENIKFTKSNNKFSKSLADIIDYSTPITNEKGKERLYDEFSDDFSVGDGLKSLDIDHEDIESVARSSDSDNDSTPNITGSGRKLKNLSKIVKKLIILNDDIIKYEKFFNNDK